MLYKIIDNFLPDDLYNQFTKTLFSTDFTWFYHDYVGFKGDKGINKFYFTHLFYGDGALFKSNTVGINSNHYNDIIEPICFMLFGKEFSLIRAKANLFTKRERHIKYGLHIDYNFDKHTTLVYSLNKNNGYTEFEDGTKIPSNENQLLIFDGNIPHRSVGQTDTKIRINLNINLNMDPEILCKN